LQLGFLQRTPRGRMLTPQVFAHLGMKAPPSPSAEEKLL
jgi:Holliday junction DNA helicase RuvB